MCLWVFFQQGWYAYVGSLSVFWLSGRDNSTYVKTKKNCLSLLPLLSFLEEKQPRWLRGNGQAPSGTRDLSGASLGPQTGQRPLWSPCRDGLHRSDLGSQLFPNPVD